MQDFFDNKQKLFRDLVYKFKCFWYKIIIHIPSMIFCFYLNLPLNFSNVTSKVMSALLILSNLAAIPRDEKNYDKEAILGEKIINEEEEFAYLRPKDKLIIKERKLTKHRKKHINPKHDFTKEINCALGIAKHEEGEAHYMNDDCSTNPHTDIRVPTKINVFTILCYLGPSARVANNIIKNIYESSKEHELEKFGVRRSFNNGNYAVQIGIFFSFLEAVKFMYRLKEFRNFKIIETKISNNKKSIIELLQNS